LARVIMVGNSTVDIAALNIGRHPGWGKEVSFDNVALLEQVISAHAGGNGGGAAHAYARLCVGSAEGVDIALWSLVGRDAWGDHVRRELAAAGVDIAELRSTDAAGTSATVVWVDTAGERSFVHYPGASMLFGLDHLDLGGLRGGQVLLLAGYLLLPALFGSPAVSLLRASREAGLKTVLDIVPPLLPPRTAADLADVLALVDYFVPNASEAALLSGEHDPAAAARALQRYGPRRVLVTLGEQGVLVADGPVQTHVPACAVEAVNPTGAGDAFNAGFCYALARGRDVLTSARFASAAAALAVSQPLGFAGVPPAGKIEAFMVARATA
jgi:sugar/nucleoside kinase (ribokinase family)